MTLRLSAATTMILASLMVSHATAEIGPPEGEFWYDWIANTPQGTYPEAESGDMVFDGGTTTATYISSEDGLPDTFGFDYTGASLTPEGYMLLHTPDGDLKAGANQNVIHALSESPDEDGILSSALMTRKAVNPTAAEATGTYSYFQFGFDVPQNGAFGSYGTVTLADGSMTWTATGTDYDADGTEAINDNGTWSVNSAASTMTLTAADSHTATFHVAQGGVLVRTDVDTTDGDIFRELLVRRGSGKTMADAAGTWLIQGLQSSLTADEVWTDFGLLTIGDDGTWSVDVQSSDGTTADPPPSGTYTIADDGTIQLLDDGQFRDAILSLDNNLMVINLADAEDAGYMVAIRPMPEPATMALVGLGLAALAARRKRR